MPGAPFAYGVAAVVHRSTPVVDRYGNETPGAWAEVGYYDGCALAPRQSDEVTAAGRQGVIVGQTIYMPIVADVRPHDRVEVGGVMFEVEGEPGRWSSPLTGWEPGVEVALRRVDG